MDCLTAIFGSLAEDAMRPSSSLKEISTLSEIVHLVIDVDVFVLLNEIHITLTNAVAFSIP